METVWSSVPERPEERPGILHRYGRRLYIQGAEPISNWQIIFLILASTLSASIGYKLASIQYLEYIYFAQILLLFALFTRRNFRITWFKPFLRIGIAYFLFALGALALAIASLRYDFFMPADIILLRYPVVITVSRLIELFANVSIMLFLASRFRKDPAQALFVLRVYFWTGVASAVYSIASLPLNLLLRTQLGTYSDLHRARGFYNEGGPYGTYLISVFLAAWVLYRMHGERPRRIFISVVLLVIALVMSASKAAFLGIFFVFFLNGIFASSLYRRLALITATLVLCVVISQSAAVQNASVAYRQASVAYERLSLKHRDDPNYVNGRVAGIFIVPRMIAAHPLTGIGWGNYALLRDAPIYRGASAWSAASAAEDHGLGMFGLTAEIGVPLIVFLLAILFTPYVLLRRRGVPLYLANLALAQPVCHLIGAQLNSTFPWIVTALALGFAFAVPRPWNAPLAVHQVS